MDLGEHIHVFDWDGHILEAFKLDRPVDHFTVDLERRRILALVRSPEPAVVAFPLPDAEEEMCSPALMPFAVSESRSLTLSLDAEVAWQQST